MSNVYDWFQERLEIQAIADDITSKYVPPHVNIFYCLGGITLTCFIVQVATGFAMTFYYRPTVTEAFSSVEYIISSQMVSKYDGVKYDSSCMSSIFNWWF
jgi:cytochrome b6